MPTTNLQPQTQTNPNLGGSSAVTGMAATGHGSTTTSASAADSAGIGDSESLTKSARWSNFEAIPDGTVNSLSLQLSWDVAGDVTSSIPDVGALAGASSSWTLEYTVNGGSNWTTIATDSASVTNTDTDSFTNTDSADISLNVSQDVSQVQVRVRYDTSANATGVDSQEATADANVVATISDIQIEAVTTIAVTAPPIMIT